MGEQNYCGAGIVRAKLMWEQGLPAMNTARSLWNPGACIASKLYSHRVARQALLPQSGRLHQRFALSRLGADDRSEEHTSELQSLMRISYAVFCLKKKTKKTVQQRRT